MELSEDCTTASETLENGSKFVLPLFTTQGGRLIQAPMCTYQDEGKKKQIRSIVSKIYAKYQEKYQEVSVTEPIRSIIFNIDYDIFRWSAVQTDFELFADFLRLLENSNDFHDTSPKRSDEQSLQDSQSCNPCLKAILWSQFSGFMHRSQTNLDESSKKNALIYYQSKLSRTEREKYANESFVGKFKLLSKITKVCPVRLDLLNDLHKNLKTYSQTTKTSASKSAEKKKTYRLFATIIIDKLSIAYCSVHTHLVHKCFQTSRLTRKPYYQEEDFLRVNYVLTPLNMNKVFQSASLTDEEVDEAREFVSKRNSIAHNISIFINILRDLQKNIDVSGLIPDSKDILRSNKLYLKPWFAKWLSHGFDSIEEYLLLLNRNFPIAESEEGSNSSANKIDVLKVAGRDFRYLMTTTGGVHRNVQVLSTKRYLAVRAKVFSKKSLDDYKENPLKLSLRMGLWLTPSVSMQLPKVKAIVEEDIGKHTDGCGRLSTYWAKKMSCKWNKAKKFINVPFTLQNVGPTQWNEKTENDAEIEYDKGCQQPLYYSAFQVRIDGMKGMFVVDTRLSDKEIIASESQVKFYPPKESRNQTVEIVQCTQPMASARLNFALISLILGCAKDDESITKLQEYIIELAKKEIGKLLTDKGTAIKFAIEHNDVKSFNMLGAGCTLLETFLAGYYQNYARRFKIRVEQSRRLFGVADFWKVLKTGEVFISVSELPNPIKGEVLVTKEPCVHRGDLRKLKAVSKDELKDRFKSKYKEENHRRYEDNLNNLNDVIVFSCKGRRAESNKIAGSDLDGDQYFVCWDETIVSNVKIFDSGNFDAIDKGTLHIMYKKMVEKCADDILSGKKASSIYNDTEGSRLYNLEDFEFYSSDELYSDLTKELKKRKRCKKEKNRNFHDDEDHKKEGRSDKNEQDDDKSESMRKNDNSENKEEDDDDEREPEEKEMIRRALVISGRTLNVISVEELFDLRMRIVDHLGNKWTTKTDWERFLSKICNYIPIALDSAKSGLSVSRKAFDRPPKNLEFPKYPHFHPSKRKDECQRSESPLGHIYEVLRKYILPTTTTEDSTSSDTLYDEICQLKLSFLLHYAKKINSSATRSQKSFEGESSFDATPYGQTLEAMQQPLKLNDIIEWYDQFSKSNVSSNFLKKEAACTMLWRLKVLLALKEKSDGLEIYFIRDGENLSNITFSKKNENLNFLCITESFYKKLENINPDQFSNEASEKGSIKKISFDNGQMKTLIETMGTLLEKSFWRWLRLPVPSAMLRFPVLNLDSELRSNRLEEIKELFNTTVRKCLERPILTDLEISVEKPDFINLKIGKTKDDVLHVLSDLRDITVFLLCFSETWSDTTYIEHIRKSLAEVSENYIKIYKYLMTAYKIFQLEGHIIAQRDFDNQRIDLTRLEEQSKEMETLYNLLFPEDLGCN